MKKKNLISFLILITCALGVIISCTHDLNYEAEFTPEQQSLVNQFSTIGEEHNKIMHLVHEELAGKIRTRSGNSKFQFSKCNVIDAVRSSSNQIISARSEINENYADQFFVVNLNKRTRSDNKNSSYIDSLINNIQSEALKNLVNDLIKTSDNYTLSIEAHKIKVNKLNERAFAELNGNNLEIFLMASSVACASFEYWHSNIDVWYETISGKKLRKMIVTRSESPYDHPLLDGMTGADIGGAVAGAIGGAWVGGVGAAPGAVVGSSGASLGKLAENAWNYFF